MSLDFGAVQISENLLSSEAFTNSDERPRLATMYFYCHTSWLKRSCKAKHIQSNAHCKVNPSTMSSSSENMCTNGKVPSQRNECCSKNVVIGVRGTKQMGHISKQSNELSNFLLSNSSNTAASTNGIGIKEGPSQDCHSGDSYPFVTDYPTAAVQGCTSNASSSHLPRSSDCAVVDRGNNWTTHSDDSLFFLASVVSEAYLARGFSSEKPLPNATLPPHGHGHSTKPRVHKVQRHRALTFQPQKSYKMHLDQQQQQGLAHSFCSGLGSMTVRAVDVQPKYGPLIGTFCFPESNPAQPVASIYVDIAVLSALSHNSNVSVNFPTNVPSATLPSCLTATHGAMLPKLLAHPDDDQVLNSHQVLLRQQIEVFQATEEEAAAHVRGRSKRIRIGQMGIRCRHCKHVPPAHRQGGAVYFPLSTMGIYQASQNLSTTHLQCGLCREMPEALRQQFAELIPSKVNASMVGRRYWSECAQKMGLVDTDDGIRFADM
jgi:hypothetical protein